MDCLGQVWIDNRRGRPKQRRNCSTFLSANTLTFNQRVLGSSPSALTNDFNRLTSHLGSINKYHFA